MGSAQASAMLGAGPAKGLALRRPASRPGCGQGASRGEASARQRACAQGREPGGGQVSGPWHALHVPS